MKSGKTKSLDSHKTIKPTIDRNAKELSNGFKFKSHTHIAVEKKNWEPGEWGERVDTPPDTKYDVPCDSI